MVHHQSKPEVSEVRRIHLALTMDAEATTVTSDATASGPKDWDLSAKAIPGYLAVARQFGLPVTYFIHPECATAQSNLWKELEAPDVEKGLHLHAWKYAKAYGKMHYYEHTGGLPESRLRDILQECMDIFKAVNGYNPTSFRPGNYSLNDSGFRVLEDLGFDGGSCSAPGRVMPEYRANWAGAPLDPHRTHAACKDVRGDMDFVNVPHSMDTSELLSGSNGRLFYANLSPEIFWLEDYGISPARIARNIVGQLLERKPSVAVITVGTHNNRDYSDPADPVTKQLVTMVTEIVQICGENGIELVGATIADIVKAVRAFPPVTEDLVLSGGIYDTKKKNSVH